MFSSIFAYALNFFEIILLIFHCNFFVIVLLCDYCFFEVVETYILPVIFYFNMLIFQKILFFKPDICNLLLMV